LTRNYRRKKNKETYTAKRAAFERTVSTRAALLIFFLHHEWTNRFFKAKTFEHGLCSQKDAVEFFATAGPAAAPALEF
jgi:hypothetical protein